MKLQALAPKSGVTFTLRVTGNHPPSTFLLVGALVVGACFLWLAVMDPPALPASLSPGARRAMLESLEGILLGLRVFTGIVSSIFLAGFVISRREYELLIEGGPGGGVRVSGASLEGRGSEYPGELGPYSVGILRRIAEMPRDAMDQDALMLYSSAQEDARADAAIARYLRTEVVLLDRHSNRHVLLRVPELLPPEAGEVLGKLKAQTDAGLEQVRGGGFVLHLPPAPGAS